MTVGVAVGTRVGVGVTVEVVVGGTRVGVRLRVGIWVWLGTVVGFQWTCLRYAFANLNHSRTITKDRVRMQSPSAKRFSE